MNEAWIILPSILLFYGPIWIVVVVITKTVLKYRQERLLDAKRTSAAWVTEMLARKTPPLEIERLLLAWSRDRRLVQQWMKLYALTCENGDWPTKESVPSKPLA